MKVASNEEEENCDNDYGCDDPFYDKGCLEDLLVTSRHTREDKVVRSLLRYSTTIHRCCRHTPADLITATEKAPYVKCFDEADVVESVFSPTILLQIAVPKV